ncbi:hypothetical protein ASPSYDRAFT_165467 [Aspergillus sydowii CBS 593.65]|uniref:Kinesin light chain n=1 Tax=Aspergillus sydowii CBS 593.65 TaxID=1036612 RepID=A0A1L9SXE7_9EURO|nr:uncharacterized protein ASPSYDRAFT_165467 [Aspergillus sydowii CBS 593.65]OJJ51875.1 hypothetical protein ASPSYDRAFT_165467 [Aspergillus sydowii CBS 593.65]
MTNLASTYGDQGRWKEAEQLEVQVMVAQKQVLGPEHPSTLTGMGNIAHTWESLGNIQDALALMSKSVELRNEDLGSDHPDICLPATPSRSGKQHRTAHQHNKPAKILLHYPYILSHLVKLI